MLAYAARARCVVSPELGTPIAYSSVDATGRNIPAMDPMQMLDHLARSLGLEEQVRAAAGLDPEGDLARPLSSFMNDNWWRAFRETEPTDPGYGEVLRLFEARIRDSSLRDSTASRLEARGLTLSTEQAYAPPATLTWKAHMAML